MSDITTNAPIPAVSEFDRLIASAKAEVPRARTLLDRVRAKAAALIARVRPAAPVAAAPAGTTVVVTAPAAVQRDGMFRTLAMVAITAFAMHHYDRKHEDQRIAAQADAFDHQAAATKTILADATTRTERAETKAVEQQAKLAEYEERLKHPQVETVTVTKDVPVVHEVTRNVFVPHETVRTVVLAGKPVPGGGCALSDDDVRRLRAFAPDAPARAR